MKIRELETPAVLVDVDIMDRNLRRLATYSAEHGLSVRPHIKTHKIPELAHRQIGLGAVGITVAKLGEAEVMVDGGIEDVLIAYPLYGEDKWRRLMSLAGRAQITINLDSVEIARAISDRAKEAGVRLKMLVEFDTGMKRCGLPVEPDSMSVVKQILDLPALEFQGVLIYPGHFLEDPEERTRLLHLENEMMSNLVDWFAAESIPLPTLSASSTPTAYMSHLFTGITEIRPGTYIFNDKNTVCCQAATYDDCAVSVLTTVVSNRVPGRAVIDGGSKTFSSDRLLSGDNVGFGYVVEDPQVEVVYLSEEHGHFGMDRATTRFEVGDRVRVIPNHVCACINMHDKIYGVQGEDVVAEWQVLGRGKVQ